MMDSTNNTHISIEEQKSLFERSIIEAFKEKISKNIIEKLTIALDEIKSIVNEIKQSNNSLSQNNSEINKKFLLNNNILDKLSRIVQRKFFNVNILIAKIYESLIDPNNYHMLSHDIILLINFSNEVLNLLESIKSTIVSKQLEKKCSSFLIYLLNFEELKTLIVSIVDERLREQKIIKQSSNQHQLTEIFKSIDSHIWNPPNSVPSTLKLLQEDRNK